MAVVAGNAELRCADVMVDHKIGEACAWIRPGKTCWQSAIEVLIRIRLKANGIDEIAERVESLSKPYPNAPQAKITLRLEPIQEGAV